MSDHMVDIYVGDERKKFRLHRDLLCERSEFFRASFEGHFKEAETQELALPEDSVKSFELLVGWLYGAPLMNITSQDDLSSYLNLIILAKKLCLEYLQNETMDHILRFYRTSSLEVSAPTIRSVYWNTFTGDPLRKIVIRCAAWTAFSNKVDVFDSDDRNLLEGGGEIAADFTSWLVRFYIYSKYYEESDMMDPRRASNCSFHKHNSTPTCSDPSQ